MVRFNQESVDALLNGLGDPTDARPDHRGPTGIGFEVDETESFDISRVLANGHHEEIDGVVISHKILVCHVATEYDARKDSLLVGQGSVRLEIARPDYHEDVRLGQITENLDQKVESLSPNRTTHIEKERRFLGEPQTPAEGLLGLCKGTKYLGVNTRVNHDNLRGLGDERAEEAGGKVAIGDAKIRGLDHRSEPIPLPRVPPALLPFFQNVQAMEEDSIPHVGSPVFEEPGDFCKPQVAAQNGADAELLTDFLKFSKPKRIRPQ